jgi:hypothetical protein
MATASSIQLDTPAVELYRFGIKRFGQPSARKLALALATLAGKTDATQATVEDLLNYLPMRYEDRSNPARISELHNGLEASLELYVRVAGGFQVGKIVARKRRRFIFSRSPHPIPNELRSLLWCGGSCRVVRHSASSLTTNKVSTRRASSLSAGGNGTGGATLFIAA